MAHIKDKKLLYHLTHIDNLESIMKHGLLSRSMVKGIRDDFKDVANQEIIGKRGENNLEDYTLFHFHPHTAFDTRTINDYKVENLVYIVIQRKFAKDNGFEIIPRHPLHGEFEKLDYDVGFENIDWNLMEIKKSDVNPLMYEEVKLVKMAECVSSNKVDPSDFHCIYAHENRLEEIKRLKRKYNQTFYVETQVWFNND